MVPARRLLGSDSLRHRVWHRVAFIGIGVATWIQHGFTIISHISTLSAPSRHPFVIPTLAALPRALELLSDSKYVGPSRTL